MTFGAKGFFFTQLGPDPPPQCAYATPPSRGWVGPRLWNLCFLGLLKVGWCAGNDKPPSLSLTRMEKRWSLSGEGFSWTGMLYFHSLSGSAFCSSQTRNKFEWRLNETPLTLSPSLRGQRVRKRARESVCLINITVRVFVLQLLKLHFENSSSTSRTS